jgi:hypothetical protein
VGFHETRGEGGDVIRLGRIIVRQAEEIRVRVEALLAAKMYRRSPDVEFLGWLNGLDDRVHRRFANKGLVPHREPTAGLTLEGLIERFLEASTVKPATLAAYKQTTDSLIEVLRGAAARGPAKPGRSTPTKRRSTLAESDRAPECSGRRGIRTPVGISQQIYSLPSLAT